MFVLFLWSHINLIPKASQLKLIQSLSMSLNTFSLYHKEEISTKTHTVKSEAPKIGGIWIMIMSSIHILDLNPEGFFLGVFLDFGLKTRPKLQQKNTNGWYNHVALKRPVFRWIWILGACYSDLRYICAPTTNTAPITKPTSL